jgi:hypothetical protein
MEQPKSSAVALEVMGLGGSLETVKEMVASSSIPSSTIQHN